MFGILYVLLECILQRICIHLVYNYIIQVYKHYISNLTCINLIYLYVFYTVTSLIPRTGTQS